MADRNMCPEHEIRFESIQGILSQLCSKIDRLADAIEKDRLVATDLREHIHRLELSNAKVEQKQEDLLTDMDRFAQSERDRWKKHEEGHETAKKTLEARIWDISKAVLGPAALFIMGLVGYYVLSMSQFITQLPKAAP